jgi:hypothetical protein
MTILVSIGFGIVVISMAFLVVVFTRAYFDKSKRADPRYRLLAAALGVGSVGVGLWAFNPLSQAFGGPRQRTYPRVGLHGDRLDCDGW